MKNRKPFTQDKGFVVDEMRNKYVCEKNIYKIKIHISMLCVYTTYKIDIRSLFETCIWGNIL